ncbi:hypothetical protein [Flavisericum labens]|uniref:hypothetical protein n=1 Tax=Flavisericum labens TaxID=3377112 RepID=UPI00387B3E8F
MTDKEIIKHIDLIIKNIEDFDAFGIKDPVFDQLKPETKDEKEYFFKLIDQIELFAKNNDLFIRRTKGDWFRLTEKGKRLKQSNKSLKHFEKSENKTEWYNKPWVGYLIAAIVFIFTVYQHFDNRSLNREVDLLNKKSDSLNNLLLTYKDSVSELKLQLDKQKRELKQDTLPKSYPSDLKN